MTDAEKWQWFEKLTEELEDVDIIIMHGKPFVIYPASPDKVEWAQERIIVE